MPSFASIHKWIKSIAGIVLWYKRNKTFHGATPSSVHAQERALSLSEKFFSLLMLHLKRLIIYFSGDPEASVPLYLLRGLLCVEEISSQIEHFYVSVKKK